MDNTIKIVVAIFIVIAIGGIVVLVGNSKAPAGSPEIAGIPGNGSLTVYYFYGAECPHCAAVKPVITSLTEKYPQVTFEELEVWHNQTNQAMMDKVNTQLGITDAGVPEVVVDTTVLIGDRDIPAKLEGVIQAALKKNQ